MTDVKTLDMVIDKWDALIILAKRKNPSLDDWYSQTIIYQYASTYDIYHISSNDTYHCDICGHTMYALEIEKHGDKHLKDAGLASFL